MIWSIAKHELRIAICNRKFWYSVAILQLALATIYQWLLSGFLLKQHNPNVEHFGITEEVIHPYLATFSLLLLVFIPVITTQTLCGERQRRTLVNLYCSPITAWQIILGKYLHLSIVLLSCLGLSSMMPLFTLFSGTIDWGQYLCSVLGIYLMASVALSTGIALSSFMYNASRCNIYIFASLLLLIMIEWAAQFTGPAAIYLQSFGLLRPLKVFFAGAISLQHLSYYLALTGIFLSITVWRIARRWYDV